MLSTHNMGGVSIQPDELRAMQANDYILHARDEKLEKVPVEKIRLPRDPAGTHPAAMLGTGTERHDLCCPTHAAAQVH